ncbi:DUF6479 family protein [Streptomyces sp. NBC_00647]|uniref:DUF6479 family protein n=1 Tax=Streptomyces sp. NBC_00647 TaxID=2975796 RepID=UPI00324ABD22
MNATNYEMALSNAALGTLGAFLGGLVLVGVLVWAVRLGIGVRRRQPDPPRTEEHPTMPSGGPVHETVEVREPDEVPRATEENERLTPHQLHSSGSKRSDEQTRTRWSQDASGSSGSGGQRGE